MTGMAVNGAARQIRDARPQARVAVTGTITAAQAVMVGGSPGYRCRLADGTGQLDLLFLGRDRVAGLTPGARCEVEAMAVAYHGRLTAWNPRYRLMPAARRPGRSPSGLPVPVTLRPPASRHQRSARPGVTPGVTPAAARR